MLCGTALLERIRSIAPAERDAFVDDLLGIGGVPDDVALPRGSVPYLPCTVDAILAMIEGAPLRSHDELVDLGSGLGRVAMLAHLISGARALGIEIQEPLVASANERRDALGLSLSSVRFVHANAADVALDGTVFFLYAPFNGPMLARVLDRVKEVSTRRPIVVCTVDVELDAPWLTRRTSTSIAIYDVYSRPR